MNRATRYLAAILIASVLVATAASDTIAAASTPLQVTATGYDISWPQCASAVPPLPGFGIVGVNNGVPFSTNKCLANELRWAQNAANGAPSFYVNTGNQGPAGNANWPSAQSTPRICTGANSVPCSYDYGWNAGRASFAAAVSAERAIGSASPASAAQRAPWWLDVETGNAWEAKATSYGPSASSYANDQAMLEGLLAYLQSINVATVGIYSTTSMWNGITGGSVTALNAVPTWVPGAGSLAQAVANCAKRSFTGGSVSLTQYPSNGYDGDYACGLLSAPVTVPVTVPASATYSYQLSVTNNNGPVTFVQTGGAPSLVVSSTGLVTTGGQLARGTYSITGTMSDSHGDRGTFSLTLNVGTIVQSAPTTGTVKVPGSATFSGQLAVAGNGGPASFVQTSGAPSLVVSSTGLVTTSGALAAGVYNAQGTVTDSFGGQGTFTFTLTVGAITQNLPTTASVTTTGSVTYSDQLSVSRNNGPVTFAQTSGAPSLVVSSTGLVTTSGALTVGTYSAKGITSDAYGDVGTYVFALTVTPTSTATTTTTTTTPAGPAALVVRGHATAGKTEVLIIAGSGFYGRPHVTSHAGTSTVVTHDTGRTLTVRVSVRAGSRKGVFIFTLAFSHGQTCKIRYVQR